VSADTEYRIGTDFVGYRIEQLIGRGGMGVVYRAYDLRLKRVVALKLLAPELALDERFRARFTRESELAMSLEHPNVVPIYDAGDVDGRLYLAMRYVEESDLRALLRAEAPLDTIRALAIVRQVGSALDAAHARGLVHRDVKPSNVLLDRSDHAYLADLGLTRRLAENGATIGEERSLGTPAYLAPEQIESGSVDGRADIYSLGCLLYECLTGKPPFAGDSRLAVAWAHLEEDPPSAHAGNPDLPQAIDAVLAKALAKAPEDRYPSCETLVAEASDALGLHQVPTLRPRPLLLFAAAVIVALAAAAVAAALVFRGTHARKSPPSVRPNTLVRIDPARDAISDVIPVDVDPSATVVGGGSVWVYNDGGRRLSEIDAASHVVRNATRLSTTAVDLSLIGGPMLAADEARAWVVGVRAPGKGLLTSVLRGKGAKKEYRLDIAPRAVAVGETAVWVLGHGDRGDEVLRVDPASGKVTGRTRFPATVQVNSLTAGLRAVWAVASSTATLYRIDSRSSKVTGYRDLGEHAGRPVVRFGNVWVPVDQFTLVVDPRTLSIGEYLCCPERGPSAAGYGSAWLADIGAGEVVRFDGRTKQVVAAVPVVTGSPSWGHPCLSSIAAGAGGVWVTVVDSIGQRCPI
jgi:serine/threonine protein kinase